MSAAQVGFGLYGALLVEDPEDCVGVADRATIVLSDIGFDAQGQPVRPLAWKDTVGVEQRIAAGMRSSIMFARVSYRIRLRSMKRY